jgi:hypothetical protein
MVDLRATLSAIESRLHDEIYNLKMMIQSIMPQNFHYQSPQHYQQNYYNPQQGFAVPNFHQQYHNQVPAPPPVHYQNNIQQNYEVKSTARPTQVKNFSTPKPATSSTENIFTAPFTKQPEVINVMKNKLKSLESGKSRSIKKIEIATSTTQEPSTSTTTAMPEPKNEYTYYWKLENFPKVFMNAKKNEVFSHVFNVKGLFLRIRAILRYHEEQTLVLDIEHLANIDNGDKFEIEISDGLVFKEIAEEKLFQYSFAVLDQTKPNHDLISPIYWNTDDDNFLVPNSVYVLANYVKNDSLLIKLIIMF